MNWDELALVALAIVAVCVFFDWLLPKEGL